MLLFVMNSYILRVVVHLLSYLYMNAPSYIWGFVVHLFCCYWLCMILTFNVLFSTCCLITLCYVHNSCHPGEGYGWAVRDRGHVPTGRDLVRWRLGGPQLLLERHQLPGLALQWQVHRYILTVKYWCNHLHIAVLSELTIHKVMIQQIFNLKAVNCKSIKYI